MADSHQQQHRKSRSVFGTVKRLLPKNQDSQMREGNPPRRTTQEEAIGPDQQEVGGRRNNKSEKIDRRKGDGTGDHVSSHQLQDITERERDGPVLRNNAQEKNTRVMIKRSKSQRSSTSLVRVPCGKRKSAVDSPTRKLNNKLTQALLQSRQSNKFYKQELNNLQAANMQEIYQLQSENEILSREHVELRQKIEQWKRRCRELKDKNGPYVKLQTIKKENHALSEDLEVCKSVICRLNAELMSCQEKLGIAEEVEANNKEISDNRNRTFVVKDVNNKCKDRWPEVMGLLLAYDQVIQDKSETIKGHENTLHQFKVQCKEIISENQDLHKQISEKQEKGMVSVEEWQFLHSNAVLVLEANDVLHDKIALFKRKEDIMMKAHEDKANKLKSRISTLEEDRAILKEAVAKSENQSKHLLEQHSRLTEILEQRIPLDQHEASVQQCKVLFEELKVNYESERSVLVEKLEMAEREKNRMSREISELEASNARLQSNLSSCEESLASNTQQFKEVYKTMVDATKARDAAGIAMEETRRLSQSIIQDRENSERLLHDQRILNENLVHLREKQSGLVCELQRKIHEMEHVHSQEVEKYFAKIHELERAKDIICMDQHQKVAYLEALVDEKSRHIDHLETEKKQLQVDLETVWKTSTSTMKEIANSR